ncbi:MAG: GNAT family N-acetyltransferase [Massilia sp.]
MKIYPLDALETGRRMPQLAALLMDVVAHGAGVGFLSALGASEAMAYWEGVAAAVADGTRVLLVAVEDGVVLGTVQLDLCQRANGRNRAEVMKMLVHSGARRRGIASVLLRALEEEARERRRGLLYLDTEAGSGGEELYSGLGYTRIGELPEYACTPDGEWRATAIYYKTLFARQAA